MCTLLSDAPWYINLLTLPLGVFNFYRFQKRDHKMYFITASEYRKDFKRMDMQFRVKSGIYCAYFVGSFVKGLFSAIKFFGTIF